MEHNMLISLPLSTLSFPHRLQIQWSKVVVGCWCIAKQVSPALPPSVSPTSCTPSVSGWTRPSTLWSSGVRSSRPTWPSWDNCCSLRMTFSARDEASVGTQITYTNAGPSTFRICIIYTFRKKLVVLLPSRGQLIWTPTFRKNWKIRSLTILTQLK